MTFIYDDNDPTPLGDDGDDRTAEAEQSRVLQINVLRSQLRAGLVEAMKQRDPGAMSVLRSAIAALDNAEAIDEADMIDPVAADGWAPVERFDDSPNDFIAGARVGVGSTEAPRRSLSVDDVRSILQSEITDRINAARHYATRGRHDLAEELRDQAEILRHYLPH